MSHRLLQARPFAACSLAEGWHSSVGSRGSEKTMVVTEDLLHHSAPLREVRCDCRSTMLLYSLSVLWKSPWPVGHVSVFSLNTACRWAMLMLSSFLFSPTVEFQAASPCRERHLAILARRGSPRSLSRSRRIRLKRT